jgi:hypothetical protein
MMLKKLKLSCKDIEEVSQVMDSEKEGEVLLNTTDKVNHKSKTLSNLCSLYITVGKLEV